jgi:hypothetical protein
MKRMRPKDARWRAALSPTGKDFTSAFGICFYGWREGVGHTYLGPNNATDLWHVKKVNPAAIVHLTEKPVELAVRAIQYSSRPGENVLDLFGGSGSTLIACEQTSRRAFLMEVDGLYCDVIVRRWEQFAGQKAERISRPDALSQPAKENGEAHACECSTYDDSGQDWVGESLPGTRCCPSFASAPGLSSQDLKSSRACIVCNHKHLAGYGATEGHSWRQLHDDSVSF